MQRKKQCLKKHGIRKDAVFFYWVRVFGNGISQPEDDR